MEATREMVYSAVPGKQLASSIYGPANDLFPGDVRQTR